MTGSYWFSLPGIRASEDTVVADGSAASRRRELLRALSGPRRTLQVVRRLLLLPAVGVLVLVGVVAFARSSSEVSASPTTAIRACIVAHGSATRQKPETVDCLTRALSDAIRTRQYAEVLTLRAELDGTAVNSSCHAAGHAAGQVLVEEFGAASMIDHMFPDPAPSSDPVGTCTAALIHGLVAGSVDGARPLPISKIAEQCVRLGAINHGYQHECAHFFGHVVWKEVGRLDGELAELCQMVGVGQSANPQRTCISGAVMQKFDLQTKHYDPENLEGQKRQPPTRDELRTLCDAFADSDFETREGCFGALGWLAAVSTSDELNHDESAPGWEDKAMSVYLDTIPLCAGSAECHMNFVNHLNPVTFASGFAKRFCTAAEVDMNVCERIITRYTK